MKNREQRVAQLVRSVVSEILLEMDFFTFPMFTITRADATKDLKLAKIYYSVQPEYMDKVKKQFASLHSRIRFLMGQKLNMRYVPEIQFIVDKTSEKLTKVIEMFGRIESEKADTTETD